MCLRWCVCVFALTPICPPLLGSPPPLRLPPYNPPSARTFAYICLPGRDWLPYLSSTDVSQCVLTHANQRVVCHRAASPPPRGGIREMTHTCSIKPWVLWGHTSVEDGGHALAVAPSRLFCLIKKKQISSMGCCSVTILPDRNVCFSFIGA